MLGAWPWPPTRAAGALPRQEVAWTTWMGAPSPTPCSSSERVRESQFLRINHTEAV